MCDVADANAPRPPQPQALCHCLIMEYSTQQCCLRRHLHHEKRLSQAGTTLLPAKQTQKAARRSCEVELLRDSDTDEELILSSVSQARQATLIDSDPAPQSHLRRTRRPQCCRPQRRPRRFYRLNTTVSLPPPPPSPPTSPPSTVQPVTLAEPPFREVLSPRPASPPPPPPWSDAFSTNSDRIICRKCCNRSYVFRWYSHCYMCHLNDSKP
jgi:hypothetical protein